eukprot:gene26505-biopygen16696
MPIPREGPHPEMSLPVCFPDMRIREHFPRDMSSSETEHCYGGI